MDLSPDFLFCSTDLYFCLCAKPYCLDDCSFVVSSDVRKVFSSSSILFLKTALAICFVVVVVVVFVCV